MVSQTGRFVNGKKAAVQEKNTGKTGKTGKRGKRRSFSPVPGGLGPGRGQEQDGAVAHRPLAPQHAAGLDAPIDVPDVVGGGLVDEIVEPIGEEQVGVAAP